MTYQLYGGHFILGASYYLKGVAPQWELGKIYRGTMEFMILQCIGLAIILFIPQTVLWLPKVLKF